MEIALQFAGALGILVPFVFLQFGRTTAHSWPYLAGNLTGAAVLTWLALREAQWGFVILQGVWALAALAGLVRLAGRGRPRGGASGRA
ncbi:CBU_0592 family membrane protein [Streptomyces montanisoli]|uniref:CBU-0592-like domain-containing protein n=1 Tax=Streptomyces montanisoli TaxID=2798581 RepID=A0A940RUH2_9ACTN|nr:hypothetical protein [Streptomyces montanisoli]MBP0457221.1 hypothetical protein [Streptomyces montanisoli]